MKQLEIFRGISYLGLQHGSGSVLRLRLFNFVLSIPLTCGPGSSVGIATDYELDDPGSNPGGDEIFRPSRPALGPT